MEAIDTLYGRGPEDITELSVKLAGIMIYLGGKAETPEEGQKMAQEALTSRTGLTQMRLFIEAQGGNGDVIYDYSLLPQPSHRIELRSPCAGYVSKINARQIGLASQHLGAGRASKEDKIDLSAGIVLNKKVGDRVEEGELLLTLLGNDLSKLETGQKLAERAFEFSDEPVTRPELIKEIIGL